MKRKVDVTRRTVLKGIAAAAAAGGPVWVGGRGPVRAVAQAKPSKLTVGAWGGLYGEAIHAAFTEPFEKATGVKVEYVRGGDASRIAKMRAEKGRQQLDVVFGTPTSASILSRELNALVPLSEKAALLPSLKDLPAMTRDPKIWTEVAVPPWTYAWTLVYRTDKIDAGWAKTVDSWHAVFDPKLKKKVGWPNITWGPGWGLTTLAMMGGAATVESGKPQDVAPGWALLPKMVPQVLTFWDGDDKAEQLISSGETWITIRSTFENSLFRKKGLPVDAFTNLKEGMIATNETISIVRSGDAAREDMAARYLNTALEVGPQAKLAEYFFTPINPKVKVPEPLAAQLLTREQVDKLNHFDAVWMGTQIDKWTEQWSKAIAS
jgi:putative spermidine/putrescine transport system substrate-binding protein